MSLKNVSLREAALPVAVLGAGPVGLAAAARLLERGIEAVIIEGGASVGANLLDYGHVRLFSPWRYDVDAAMAALLEPAGWQHPPEEDLPLASEIVEQVLRPFAGLPQIARILHLDTRVVAVSREGFDKVKSAGREQAPFVIRAMRGGRAIEYRARAVIDATGTWGTPNPLGANAFLMATGFEQVRSVVAAIAGDLEAADRVELDLPETGVCSVGSASAAPKAAQGCCGGPATQDASACCALDEEKKAQGEAGCGCSDAEPAAAPAPVKVGCCG